MELVFVRLVIRLTGQGQCYGSVLYSIELRIHIHTEHYKVGREGGDARRLSCVFFQ